MRTSQYLVQARTHGEPWKTHLKTSNFVEAEAYGAQLAALRLSLEVYGRSFATYPFVRVMRGKTHCAGWSSGLRMREGTVPAWA